MSTETELREQLATCARILAMRGLLGLYGHISVYDPAAGRIYLTPGSGSDKASLQADDMWVVALDGTVLEAHEGRVALEWPIHTAIHAARPDALAVAHLHAHYTTLFAIARRPIQPVTLLGSLFSAGVPLYRETRLIEKAAQGTAVAATLGDKQAVLLRNHGCAVVGGDIQEMLYAAVLLEDNAQKAAQAAALGELEYLTPEESATWHADPAAMAKRRAQLTWTYFTRLEARWDRQSTWSAGPLA